LEKRVTGTDRQAGPAGWTINAAQLQFVAKTEPATPLGPTLVQPSAASKNGFTRQEANPLDCLTWEERFWFAFQAILELERDLEELQVREECFRCITCRRETS
jgi:hypothetical protein